MADIKTIAEAKLTALALGKWLGKAPELDIQEDHVRLYWPSSVLIDVQKNLENSLKERDKKVKVDIIPVMLPVLIKRYGIFAAGALASAFLLGRK